MNSALLTDLYQLSMMQAYHQAGMTGIAVFELFVRRLPDSRNFLVAAGLEQALEFLENLKFTARELDWLGRTGKLKPEFIETLVDFRFTGDVLAVPEGTVFFPDEPIVQVIAPLREAQLIESRLLNLIHFQTVIASKAVRCVLAAPDRLLVDFGFRRAHGSEAGFLAARATYLAGFAGTSTVQAGHAFGIPIYGTMAHSFIQAHEDEKGAFADFARSQSIPPTLLVDTYDTEEGATRATQLGLPIAGVRIDSGDLDRHARDVRAILDRGGLRDARIFASGNLDEEAIAALLSKGAPIDGFGVGTRLATSADAPYLDCVYKLQEYSGRPKRKRSEGKATWPGRKQVYRLRDTQGAIRRDVLTLAGDQAAKERGGKPLLTPFMNQGKRVRPAEPLNSIRARVQDELRALPASLKRLSRAEPGYPVEISGALRELTDKLDQDSACS